MGTTCSCNDKEDTIGEIRVDPKRQEHTSKAEVYRVEQRVVKEVESRSAAPAEYYFAG